MFPVSAIQQVRYLFSTTCYYFAEDRIARRLAGVLKHDFPSACSPLTRNIVPLLSRAPDDIGISTIRSTMPLSHYLVSQEPIACPASRCPLDPEFHGDSSPRVVMPARSLLWDSLQGMQTVHAWTGDPAEDQFLLLVDMTRNTPGPYLAGFRLQPISRITDRMQATKLADSDENEYLSKYLPTYIVNAKVSAHPLCKCNT
ncbi:hypothetical protein ABW21_db0205465 [Orbilia brochopaga]|nr:hypothetical protein ABW21_db0205465 [Drechslerella brochopaga]